MASFPPVPGAVQRSQLSTGTASEVQPWVPAASTILLVQRQIAHQGSCWVLVPLVVDSADGDEMFCHALKAAPVSLAHWQPQTQILRNCCLCHSSPSCVLQL